VPWTVPTKAQGTQRTSILFVMFLYFALKRERVETIGTKC
jgi:hypothetical protein